MTAPAEGGTQEGPVVIGCISGIFGVRGWLKIISYSRPPENIFTYHRWLLGGKTGWRSYVVNEHRLQGKNLLVSLENIQDRDVARDVLGLDIAVWRKQLPALGTGEYYWCDLMQLQVFDQAGHCFGKVSDIQETGANDVLVVEGENKYLIPLVQDKIVKKIDLESGRILVDWNPEYL